MAIGQDWSLPFRNIRNDDARTVLHKYAHTYTHIYAHAYYAMEAVMCQMRHESTLVKQARLQVRLSGV